MLRVHQLVLSLDDALHVNDALLRRLCARQLKIKENQIAQVRMSKRSVDARGKEGVHFTLTVDVQLRDASQEEKTAKRFKPNQVGYVPGGVKDKTPDVFALELPPWPRDRKRPVVVGAGPAGLFCALALAVRGARPILIERGQSVDQRAKDIETLETSGVLDPESNVLFGEGGAGAFSDGKLTCGLSNAQIRTVLKTLVTCGAPEEILLSQRPHIGTDELRGVLKRARAKLIHLGGEVRFGCRLTGLALRDGHVCEAKLADGVIETDDVFLAIGHSARDTYQWLFDMGLPMQPKPFAIGARIEHLQSDINRAQYGASAGHPALPPAEYKLNVPTPDNRGVYTFCMCPGGQVINASSEMGGVNVNGMSLHARDGINANAAVLVGVRPEDFGSDHPLAGVQFQREIEQAAFRRTGSLKAPCQRVADLLSDKPTTALGSVLPGYRPGVEVGELKGILPAFVLDNMRQALPQLGRRLRGFDFPDALLTGPETRSSSPLRMLRNEQRESPIGGLYPLGEGAGYAGGIVSAALDGMLAGMEVHQ
ncbi:MAG: NAD(P)/FAD-dependent oxidoreductase [Clostridia bacterium]|nr:NAD(P)/FAD-dependent oxidoreductase [Clostridia bacterium]